LDVVSIAGEGCRTWTVDEDDVLGVELVEEVRQASGARIRLWLRHGGEVFYTLPDGMSRDEFARRLFGRRVVK
jgi:hypothetical protein